MRFSSGVRLRLGTAARRRERQYAVTNHGGSDARARAAAQPSRGPGTMHLPASTASADIVVWPSSVIAAL